LLFHNSTTSQPIPAAAPNPPPAAIYSNSSLDAAKEARMNNERLCVLANTLMNDDMMEQYGSIAQQKEVTSKAQKDFSEASQPVGMVWNHPRSTAALPK
jgi:hypothetical protein